MSQLYPDFRSGHLELTAARDSATPVRIPYVTGGTGPPLLLLHGAPQTHAIWHKVAPALAQHFTVVATDLRGYGDASKPDGGADHAGYSKRAMAADQVDVMRHLGHSRFRLAGHDRGGRVAHRLALDHPQAVERMMLLDISPTLTMYERTTMAFATAYYHWFFLIQPAPYPEELIAANPEVFLRRHMGNRHGGLAVFSSGAFAEYLRCIRDAGTVHAICEDYRAAATIDLEHDRADLAAGRKLSVRLRVLWGKHGVIERCFSALDDWREVSDSDVNGRALDCGHYIPEEAPEELTREMLAFFRA